MNRRQTIPRQWLIVTDASRATWPAVRKLPITSGILLILADVSARDRQNLMRRLRRLARSRYLTIVDELDGDALRVHDLRQLRRALLHRTPFILLSPMYPTGSHPDLSPLPRMRAAALARLAGRRLVALGGMNERRFAQVRALGFQAWAGISAFRT
jgi:thiamine-phosphate pyrophosphorylase